MATIPEIRHWPLAIVSTHEASAPDHPSITFFRCCALESLVNTFTVLIAQRAVKLHFPPPMLISSTPRPPTLLALFKARPLYHFDCIRRTATKLVGIGDRDSVGMVGRVMDRGCCASWHFLFLIAWAINVQLMYKSYKASLHTFLGRESGQGHRPLPARERAKAFARVSVAQRAGAAPRFAGRVGRAART